MALQPDNSTDALTANNVDLYKYAIRILSKWAPHWAHSAYDMPTASGNIAAALTRDARGVRRWMDNSGA
jgi:hypothetical protein